MKTACYYFLVIGLLPVILVAKINENLLPISNNIEIAQRISCCVEKAVKALFTPSNDVTIIASNHDKQYPELLRAILKETFANATLEILTKFRTTSVDNSDLSLRESSFVMIENQENCRRIMEHPSVDRWVEYIIVIESTFQWLSEFADRLWNLGFTKVAFIAVTPNLTITLLRSIQNSTARGSTPSLKSFDLCDEDITSRVTLPENIWKITMTIHPFSSMLQTPTNANLTYTKTRENLEGRHYLQGLSEIRLGYAVLRIFGNKYNLKLNRIQPNVSVTWNDAMRQCVSGEFDIFYNRQVPPEKHCCEEVNPVAWFAFENMVFVDSQQTPPHKLTGFFQPYRRSVWICTLIVFGAFIFFAYAIETLWSQNLIREQIAMLHIWSIFVGQSVPSLPVKCSLRIVLGIWILYSLQNNLLYTGTFSSALTNFDKEDFLTTFQDILDSERLICGNKIIKQLLINTNDSLMLDISDRMEPMSSLKVFNKILNENYIGARHLSYVWLHNWINRRNSSRQLYIISEASIINFPLYFFVKKRHPYQNDLNVMIGRIRDAGIIEHLLGNYTDISVKPRIQSTIFKTSGHLLDLKHLQAVFYTLFIGYFISVIVFLVELHML